MDTLHTRLTGEEGMGKGKWGKGDGSSDDLKFMIFVLYLLLGSHTHATKASTLLTFAYGSTTNIWHTVQHIYYIGRILYSMLYRMYMMNS